MKILMVLTSHDQLGNTGKKTGFWLEELAAPYYVFKDAGAEIVLASPKGGQPPLDPKSNEPDSRTDATNRFEADAEAQAKLASTEKLSAINPHDFDGIFYPGGHGPLWDLAEDPASISLIETFIGADKPVALVCHAPGVLRHVKGQDGKPLVQGKEVTGFTNTEEEAVGLTRIVPFLVEDELAAKGGRFTRVAKTLGVARSNLVDRLQGKAKPRRRYHKAQDAALVPLITALVAARPTYGYRRITAILNRQLRSEGLAPCNHKRTYRIMKALNLLLARKYSERPEHVHDGKVIVMRSNLRWCSDGFEFTRLGTAM